MRKYLLAALVFLLTACASGQRPSQSTASQLANPPTPVSALGKPAHLPPPTALPTKDSLEDAKIASARAQASWDALVQYLSLPNQPGLFAEDIHSKDVAYVFSLSQVMHAALDLAMLTGNNRNFAQAVGALAEFKLVNTYTGYAPTIHPPLNASRFRDDNGLIGLALMQAFNQDSDSKYLNLAQEIWP